MGGSELEPENDSSESPVEKRLSKGGCEALHVPGLPGMAEHNGKPEAAERHGHPAQVWPRHPLTGKTTQGHRAGEGLAAGKVQDFTSAKLSFLNEIRSETLAESEHRAEGFRKE